MFINMNSGSISCRWQLWNHRPLWILGGAIFIEEILISLGSSSMPLWSLPLIPQWSSNPGETQSSSFSWDMTSPICLMLVTKRPTIAVRPWRQMMVVMKKMRRNWTLIKLLMRSWGSKISCWTNMLRFCLFALITSEEVIYSYRVCLWYWFWLSGFGFCHLSFCSHLCYSNPWQSLPPCLSAWILLRFVSGAVLVMYMIWYHGWIWNNPMNIGLQF